MEDEEDERIESAWKERWDARKCLVGRDGDHLMTPFECDVCMFVKLKERLPMRDCEKDQLLVACARRVNLDALWSRESATVAGNLRNANKILRMATSVGLAGPFVSRGPMPKGDNCAYQLAITMVLASRQPGRYDKSHAQFDSIRHMRSGYSNFINASSQNHVQTK